MPDTDSPFVYPPPELVGATALFMTGEEALKLSAYSSANLGLTVRGRFLPARTADDQPAPRPLAFEQVLGVTADRALRAIVLPLGVGWLLDATVRITTGSTSTGRTYAVLSVVRGLTSIGIDTTTLAQGYVTATQRIGWPMFNAETSVDDPVALRSITGSNPAAGAELLEAVPTGARWELLSASATLSTSAAVASRTPRFLVRDGTNNVVSVSAQSALPASTGRNYNWFPGAVVQVPGVISDETTPTPIGLIMLAGYTFGTYTAGLQAGDQWSFVNYLVKEWLEVP